MDIGRSDRAKGTKHGNFCQRCASLTEIPMSLALPDRPISIYWQKTFKVEAGPLLPLFRLHVNLNWPEVGEQRCKDASTMQWLYLFSSKWNPPTCIRAQFNFFVELGSKDLRSFSRNKCGWGRVTKTRDEECSDHKGGGSISDAWWRFLTSTFVTKHAVFTCGEATQVNGW